jgi:hypothetical protein
MSHEKNFLFIFDRLIALSWTVVFILAALPLFPIPYFNEQFYSRSGTCLALHITNQKPAGWEYSVAIFLCINLTAFIIIAACYTYMYKTIKSRARKMSKNRHNARQNREAQVKIHYCTDKTINSNKFSKLDQVLVTNINTN